jgi:hypothetical protein
MLWSGDGIVIVSWLEDALRDFCRAVVPLRMGVSNTRALFLYSEMFILSSSLNIEERSQ